MILKVEKDPKLKVRSRRWLINAPEYATALVPIHEILTWDSVDKLGCRWSYTLEEKRSEYSYDEALDFLAREGFRTYLGYDSHSNGNLEFGNGHHRLAAAIELGYRFVPLIKDQYVEVWGDELFPKAIYREYHDRRTRQYLTWKARLYSIAEET